MARIFVSYRHDDAPAHAGRIYDRLSGHFGPELVFFDRNTIAPGADFMASIHKRVTMVDVLIAVVGRNWLNAKDKKGGRRLDNPGDWVRTELEIALARGIAVYPILVSGASMPTLEQLPQCLQEFCRHSAVEISEAGFTHEMDRLIHLLSSELMELDKAIETQRSLGQPRLDTVTFGVNNIKICMLGSYGVGKTSLVSRFVHSCFSAEYHSTIGVKIDKKPLNIGGRPVALMVWDMAGEDEGTPIKLIHVKNALGYIVVADGCRASTLWKALEIQRRVSNEIGPVPFVLVVNKTDMQSKWEITESVLDELRKTMTVLQLAPSPDRGLKQCFSL